MQDAGQGHQPLGLLIQCTVVHHDPVHGVDGVYELRIEFPYRLQGVRGIAAHVGAHLSELVRSASVAVTFVAGHG